MDRFIFMNVGCENSDYAFSLWRTTRLWTVITCHQWAEPQELGSLSQHWDLNIQDMTEFDRPTESLQASLVEQGPTRMNRHY